MAKNLGKKLAFKKGYVFNDEVNQKDMDIKMRLLLGIMGVLGLAFISGCCGFEPVNGTAVSRTQTGHIIPPITLPQPSKKNEYLLKNELQRLLPNDRGDYRLTWLYTNQITGTSLNRNNDYTRYNNNYTLSWRLLDRKNNVVKSSTSRTNIGLNILKTGYPTTAAQQDADRQAAKILSQDVYNQLRAYFKQKK